MKNPVKAEQEVRATYRGLEDAPEFNRTQLAVLMAAAKPKESAYRVALDASQVYKLAKSLAGLSVASCNYDLSARQETRRENISKDITLIASWYGWKAECHGDPRGYVVRLAGPGIEKNGWGDGFGVA